MRTGKLDAFFETGTEGVVWSVVEDGKKGYDALNGLQDGDYLRIFDEHNNVVFDGEVRLEWKRNYRPHPMNPQYGQQEVHGFWVRGLQDNVEPEDWSHWFHGQYRCEFEILDRERIKLRLYPAPDESLDLLISKALAAFQQQWSFDNKELALESLANNWKWDTEVYHSFMADGFYYTLQKRVMEKVRQVAHAFEIEPSIFLEQLIATYFPNEKTPDA